MQINSISAAAFAAATPPKQVKIRAANTLSNAGATTNVTANSNTTTATAAAASGAGQVPVPTQSAANTATFILDSTIYSTNVGGKSYTANISQANGTYTLSVPNLPGSSVTASSLTAAENALNLRIDLLV
jgi:hypothetical protein